MPDHSRQRRRTPSVTSFAASAAAPTPWLVAGVDLGLLAALWLVPACLGGRLAAGQVVLVVAAVWTAACWSLHQILSRECQWIWTRSEWLWAAAAGLVLLQLTPLSQDWLDWLSPHHSLVLAEWNGSEGEELFGRRWNLLSFDPAATRSSLATFAAYGCLFFVAVQRFRDQADVARLLRWVAVVTVAVAAFSLVQYAFSNGKFYGVLQHPFSNPQRYNLGPFTNRNHLAQFLAFGAGPLLWWWLTTSRAERKSESSAHGFGAPTFSQPLPLHAVFVTALGLVVTALLLTQSRGGVLALAVSVLTALAGLHRSRQVSAQFVIALLVAVGSIGLTALLFGTNDLTRRFDESSPEGRWQIWRANLDMLKHFPWVGTGVSTHVYSHQLFLDREYVRREYTHADNSYLQVASECGTAGLAIGALMLLTCGGWVLGVLWRRTDADRTAIMAAVAASLAANLAHAVFDFLWYVPGLVVPLIFMAAAARRLSLIDLETACGWRTPQLPWPRLCYSLACCGIVALAPWLWQQKAPAMAAEPHRLRLLNLIFVPWTVFPVDEHPETQTALLREKAKSAVRAAKADRHDGHAQLNAALAYRQMFDLLQEQNDHAMSFAQLRDAAQASGFSSAAELRDWLTRAAGKNLRLLDAAWNCAQRSLTQTPLEGGAYICLAELSCLHDPTGELEQRLLAQALAVRPYDPDILFAAGREALLLGREEQALELLRRAFRYGPVFQKRIAELLAVDRDGEFFRRTFDPNWQALVLICDAFRTYDRTEELQSLLQHCAAASAAFAREQADEQQAAPAWLAARTAWNELQQPDQAIALLQEAVGQHPHSFALRSALGKDLYRAERFAEAATHLRWASSRKPDDQYLKSLAGLAVRAALQTATPPQPITPATFERER